VTQLQSRVIGENPSIEGISSTKARPQSSDQSRGYAAAPRGFS
jgi:hypothetical protein